MKQKTIPMDWFFAMGGELREGDEIQQEGLCWRAVTDKETISINKHHISDTLRKILSCADFDDYYEQCQEWLNYGAECAFKNGRWEIEHDGEVCTESKCKQPKDAINPSHYTSRSVECIYFKRWLPSSLADAFKYYWRNGMKDASEQELAKADWYVMDYIHNPTSVIGFDQHLNLSGELKAIKNEFDERTYTQLQIILRLAKG